MFVPTQGNQKRRKKEERKEGAKEGREEGEGSEEGKKRGIYKRMRTGTRPRPPCPFTLVERWEEISNGGRSTTEQEETGECGIPEVSEEGVQEKTPAVSAAAAFLKLRNMDEWVDDGVQQQ